MGRLPCARLNWITELLGTSNLALCIYSTTLRHPVDAQFNSLTWLQLRIAMHAHLQFANGYFGYRQKFNLAVSCDHL
jgi:hypothetical protein